MLQRYGEKPVVKEYTGGLTPSQLRIVIEYIQAHLDRDLSLNTLASLIHISSHYFASLFKQSTGISPHKYITQCRLEKAKQLLRQDIAIALICQSVGFKNQSHFTTHGFDLPLFWSQLFTNRISTYFAFDLLVSSIVFGIFVFKEGNRLNLRFPWLYIVLNWVIGLSFALPLFLWVRLRQIDKMRSSNWKTEVTGETA